MRDCLSVDVESVFHFPVMGTSIMSNRRVWLSRPCHCFTHAHYVLGHEMSNGQWSIITLNCFSAGSALLRCISFFGPEDNSHVHHNEVFLGAGTLQPHDLWAQQVAISMPSAWEIGGFGRFIVRALFLMTEMKICIVWGGFHQPQVNDTSIRQTEL